MFASKCDRFGPASYTLELEKLPKYEQSVGEVLVRLETSGVNPSNGEALGILGKLSESILLIVLAQASGWVEIKKPPIPGIIPHCTSADSVESARQIAKQSNQQFSPEMERAMAKYAGRVTEFTTIPQYQTVKNLNNTPAWKLE